MYAARAGFVAILQSKAPRNRTSFCFRSFFHSFHFRNQDKGVLQATVDVMTAEQYADDDIKQKPDSVFYTCQT